MQQQVKNLEKEKTHSQRLVEKLNDEYLDQLLEENKRLREIVAKYEKLVEMGLLKIPEDMKL